jgi:hypothetical protein
MHVTDTYENIFFKMRTELFCVITQRVLVILYRRFGKPIGGCLETSAMNCHSLLRYNPEE